MQEPFTVWQLPQEEEEEKMRKTLSQEITGKKLPRRQRHIMKKSE